MSLTESEMMSRVRARFPLDKGWATFGGIRNHRGFKHPKGEKTRTIDGMAVGLWQSLKAEVLGFECKSSRSDFLREVADPSKSDAFYPHCNRFWLVVGDAKVASPDEVPMGWGLLVPRGNGLVEKVRATRKQTDGLPIGIMLSLLASISDGEESSLARARAEERKKVREEFESGVLVESKLASLKSDVSRLERELKWAQDARDRSRSERDAAHNALEEMVNTRVDALDIVRAYELHRRLRGWKGGVRDVETLLGLLDPVKEALGSVAGVLRASGGGQ